MYLIAMQGRFGQYFMKANRSFVFDVMDAVLFKTREEAERVMNVAAANGKKAMFKDASVKDLAECGF